MMSIGNQVELCSQHFNKWRDVALTTFDKALEKKAIERAFFWLELQAAFVVLWAIEQTKGKDPQTKMKLIAAKANLSKKLADYAKEILNELNL